VGIYTCRKLLILAHLRIAIYAYIYTSYICVCVYCVGMVWLCANSILWCCVSNIATNFTFAYNCILYFLLWIVHILKSLVLLFYFITVLLCFQQFFINIRTQCVLHIVEVTLQVLGMNAF